MIRRGLFWFRNDLRLEDNPALRSLAERVDELLCVYVVDAAEFERNRYGFVSTGEKRWSFIVESLHALDHELRRRGNQLVVLRGRPAATIERLCRDASITELAMNLPHGYREQQQWKAIQAAVPWVAQGEGSGTTLLSPIELSSCLPNLPRHFTPFFRAVQTLSPRHPEPAPAVLPGSRWMPTDCALPRPPPTPTLWTGGAAAALGHLQDYLFATGAVRQYEFTRDAFDGWFNSSKLSPWLAQGCLSPIQVLDAIDRFEDRHGRCASTEKFRYELYWREFFQWQSLHNGPRTFAFGGIRDRRPLTSYYPLRLKLWCEGGTPYPIVNACMRELRETGYMSNRGRQLVASCFVNELSLDWRYGAAFFEQELIDYDVAVNWGNWQYIAGVGTDPRGGRHFDLKRQAERHDPGGTFVQRWAPHDRWGELTDAVDIVDWPIMPPWRPGD